MDGINLDIQGITKKAILAKIDDEIARIKESGEFQKRVEGITGFALSSATFDYSTETLTTNTETTDMEATTYDIERHFRQSGALLGEGLHIDYWARNASRDHVDVQVEVIVLVKDALAMENLNAYAEEQFVHLYEENKRAIARLSEARKLFYERLINASARQIAIPWELPSSIDYSVGENDKGYPNHLYCGVESQFITSLNAWEDGVIEEELRNGAVCWLRNLDRKKWSLEIPYEVGGVAVPMFPDLIVVRSVGGENVFDILEPHDPSRKDNFPKAVGLAKFAEKHWDIYGRIQLIRKERGYDGKEHFIRLDVGNTQIQQRVRRISSNDELDLVFEEYGKRED